MPAMLLLAIATSDFAGKRDQLAAPMSANLTPLMLLTPRELM
jgi:hypothetical protein